MIPNKFKYGRGTSKTVPYLAAHTKSQYLRVPPPLPPAVLQDYASVKPRTVEPQHHNTHNHKVYMPHQNLRFIIITQHNTNFHKTKNTVFHRRTDVANNNVLQNILERKGAIGKLNVSRTPMSSVISSSKGVHNGIDCVMYFELDNDDM